MKKIRIQLTTDEPQTISISVNGPKSVTAADIKAPSQVTIMNTDQHIAEITDKKTKLSIEMTVEKGLGYMSKETLQKDKANVGTIVLDAIFTPIRRVNYEVENMRVGDRTDFNRLRIFIQTDGSLLPREALEKSIEIMIHQLKAIVGFKEEEIESTPVEEEAPEENVVDEESTEKETEFLKTRVETLDLSARTVNALSVANIRTVGGIAQKKEEDILNIEGLGRKGLQEIRRALSNYGIILK